MGSGRPAGRVLVNVLAHFGAETTAFDWLREPDADAVATPPMFMAFDLLHHDGRELTGRPLRDRRARLENVVAGSDLVLPVRRLAKNGFEAWAEVIAHDYEGLVAKEEDSCTSRGRRGGC
jgi:bifunctional non-homologous end joining protein LigD